MAESGCENMKLAVPISGVKPILKYRGGKSQELSNYLSYIPKFNTYYEPFFGGGATFFALAPHHSYVADINHKLMNFYQDLVVNYPKTKRELSELQAAYDNNRQVFLARKKKSPDSHVIDPNDDLYYSIRDMFNKKKARQYTYSTLYFFLNKTAYSGMIRYNKKGEFNVPYGRYAHFNTNLLNNQQVDLLKSATIANESYEQSFKLATSNDFIFLDPPYDTKFSSYGNEEFTGDFGETEHRKLAQDFKNLSAPALMVISSTPLTEELYRDFIQGRYAKNYSVNIKNRFNSKAEHLIVANYDISKV
ncbi:DNA adenine methylase [Limosilactobacillus reuteri]